MKNIHYLIGLFIALFSTSSLADMLVDLTNNNPHITVDWNGKTLPIQLKHKETGKVLYTIKATDNNGNAKPCVTNSGQSVSVFRGTDNNEPIETICGTKTQRFTDHYALSKDGPLIFNGAGTRGDAPDITGALAVSIIGNILFPIYGLVGLMGLSI